MAIIPAPTIPTFPAGYGPGPADFNTRVQQPLAFLTNRPICRVRQTVTQSGFATEAVTPISFDTVDEDSHGGWVATANTPNYRYLAQVSGWYLITVVLRLTTSNVGYVQAGNTAVNGNYSLTNYNSGSAGISAPGGVSTAAAPIYLAAGIDYVQGCLSDYIDSKVATTATPGMQSTMEICWVAS